MRLIDSDRLKAFLEMARYTWMSTDLNSIIKIIDEQPTAYDVDKVVEQLESCMCSKEIENISIGSSMRNDDYRNAIEIVRKGGVE